MIVVRAGQCSTDRGRVIRGSGQDGASKVLVRHDNAVSNNTSPCDIESIVYFLFLLCLLGEINSVYNSDKQGFRFLRNGCLLALRSV